MHGVIKLFSDSTAPMKYTMSCSSNLRRPRFTNIAAPFLLFLIALIVSVPQTAAQKRRQPTSKPQATPNANATAQQKSLRKKLTAPRISDTSEGSRVTIASDGVLNDYSAYRSGNRFYVVIPEADAPQVAGGVHGRGFENVQVQKRGGDAVISFQLQPGTAARVSQKFNKLDVVFSAPNAAPTAVSTNNPKANQKSDQKPAQKNDGTQKPAITPRVNETTQPNISSNQQPNTRAVPNETRQPNVPGTRNNPQSSENVRSTAQPTQQQQQQSTPNNAASLPSLNSGFPTQAQSSNSNAATNAAATNAATAASPSVAPPADEIAQQTQSAPLAPNTSGANDVSATTSTATATSFGAVVARNWLLALIAALVLGALGLAFAMRSGSSGRPDAAAASAQQAAIRQNTLASLDDDVPSLPEPDASAHDIASANFSPTAANVAEAATLSTVAAASTAPQESSYTDASHFVADEATKEIEPIAPAVDVERAEIETQNLLAGEPYDETIIGARDPGARQIIVAGLLAALAGRNAQKRDNARAAFIKHGYFDEAANDLSTATAPAERTSAARHLGLVRDTAATPYLVAALEDSSPEVRRAAVEALAEVRDPQAVAPLEALRNSEKNRKERNRKIPRALIQRAIEACVIGQEKIEPPPIAAAATTPAPPVVAESTIAEPVVAETAVVETAAPFVAAEEETPTIEAAPVNVEPQIIAATETTHTANAVEDSFAPVAETSSATIESAPPVAPDHSFIEAAHEDAQPTALASEPSFNTEESAVSPSVFESNFADDAITATQFAPPLSPQQELTEASSNVSDAVPSIAYTPDPLIERHDDAGAAEGWVEVDMSEPEIVSHAAPISFSTAQHVIETNAADEAVANTIAGNEAAPEYFIAEPVIEATPAFNAPYIEEAAAPITPEIVEETRPHISAAPTAKGIDVAVSDKGLAPFGEDLSAVPSAILHRLASEDPTERASAVEDLARVSGEDSFREISAAFDDPSQEVSNAAARSLFNLNPDRAASFTRALREAPPERRRKIGSALASSGLAADAIGHLMGESREKTYDAFSLLFLMSKAGEVQPLMKAIEDHPNNEVRLAVVKLLALSGQQEILPAFRRLAVRGSLPTEVRSAVMEAIYQISSQTSPDASSAA